MKKEKRVLTYEQARELNWFCKNVMGVRNDMYDVFDKVKVFEDRIKRLEETCNLIEKFFGEELKEEDKRFEDLCNRENITAKIEVVESSSNENE